jgi:hypothetical protein
LAPEPHLGDRVNDLPLLRHSGPRAGAAPAGVPPRPAPTRFVARRLEWAPADPPSPGPPEWRLAATRGTLRWPCARRQAVGRHCASASAHQSPTSGLYKASTGKCSGRCVCRVRSQRSSGLLRHRAPRSASASLTKLWWERKRAEGRSSRDGSICYHRCQEAAQSGTTANHLQDHSQAFCTGITIVPGAVPRNKCRLKQGRCTAQSKRHKAAIAVNHASSPGVAAPGRFGKMPLTQLATATWIDA